jgi:TonB family protein
MNKRFSLLALTLGLILMAPSILTAEDILIQIHLFRAAWNEGTPHPQQVEILKTSSRPELASLKEKAPGPENLLTAAAIEALMDICDLGTVDDLFLHEKNWSGRERLPLDDRIQGTQIFYRVKLSPKRLPNQQIALRIVISRGKHFSADAETLIDQELILDLGDPVIVAAPYQGQAFFAMALVRSSGLKEAKREPEKAPKVEIVALPKALHEVPPSYPEELRRRRIGGVVGLLVQIDEKGSVQAVGIEHPAHPYLNYSIVQAMRQWTFGPVFTKGKPAPARFRFSYSFYPTVYEPIILTHSPWPEPGAFSSEVLQSVLNKCGEYCRKLAGAALDFFCEETIKEIHFSLLKSLKWKSLDIWVGKPPANEEEERENRLRGYNPYGVQKIIKGEEIQIMDPTQTKRNNFLCDYQIVRKGGELKERRILLKENGRPNADRTKLLEEARFSRLSPLFAPLKILLPDQQPKYFYRIADGEKVQGRKAYVVEASPKSGDEDGIWAVRVWVDQGSFLILKCEIEGIPVEGYEDVLNDCAVLNIRPQFTTTHEYRTEKGGVLFPSRSKVSVAYRGFGRKAAVPWVSMVLDYDKYRFFLVETEHKIIK